MSGTVVLVHGLWLNRMAMLPLSRAFGQAGLASICFEYDGRRGGLDAHADALRGAIGAAAASAPGAVHVAGHSLGGLVALRALEKGLDLIRGGRVLLLGSPLAGSLAARQFARHAFGRWMLGASLELWRAGSCARVAPGLQVGVIAGTRAFGLGPLFTALPGVSDGVVRVEETQIAGLADHIVLNVSHTAMLISDEVARQGVAFLRGGRFLR